MGIANCEKCQLVTNRKGEGRPGLKCPECNKDFCYNCAEMAPELCRMMRDLENSFWKCKECITKGKSLQSTLESIQHELSTIKKGQSEQLGEREKVIEELNSIKKGQEEAHAERRQVIEGLKKVEDIAKRMDKVEEAQAANKTRLDEQAETIRANTEEVEKVTKKTKELEGRIEKMDGEAPNIRQTNAVVKEIREIEKREKNLLFCNIPESTSTETEERIKHDKEKVMEIMKEMKIEDVKPLKVIRVGHEGRYARKTLAIFKTMEECERIVRGAEDTVLTNDVFVQRDRTYNQREEARLYRLEREKEEREGIPMARGNRRGGARGTNPRGRPRGRGSMRGRGATGRLAGSASRARSDSRKRRNSDEGENAKRRKTGDERDETQKDGEEPESMVQGAEGEVTPTQANGSKNRPATPHPMALPITSTNGQVSNDGQVF